MASRGIDFPHITYVINKEIPQNIEDYVHRVGRTGRSGLKGTAITLVKENESKVCLDLKKMLEKFKQEIPQWFEKVCQSAVDDFKNNRGSRGGNSNNRNRNNNDRNYNDNRSGNGNRNFERRDNRSRMAQNKSGKDFDILDDITNRS